MMDELRKHPHPALVHFPITLFPVSLVFLLLYRFQHNAFFLHASFWTLMFSVLMTLPTAITGWHDMTRTHSSSLAARHAMQLHLVTGILITFIAILAGITFLAYPPMTHVSMLPLYTTLLVVLSILVIAQGAIGGILVYKHRMGIE